MKQITVRRESMTLEQMQKAVAIAIIHNAKHWSVRKKLYVTKYGTFAVRCAKTIIVRLVK